MHTLEEEFERLVVAAYDARTNEFTVCQSLRRRIRTLRLQVGYK
jgi:hypothetical protein